MEDNETICIWSRGAVGRLTRRKLQQKAGESKQKAERWSTRPWSGFSMSGPNADLAARLFYSRNVLPHLHLVV